MPPLYGRIRGYSVHSIDQRLQAGLSILLRIARARVLPDSPIGSSAAIQQHAPLPDEPPVPAPAACC